METFIFVLLFSCILEDALYPMHKAEFSHGSPAAGRRRCALATSLLGDALSAQSDGAGVPLASSFQGLVLQVGFPLLSYLKVFLLWFRPY